MEIAIEEADLILFVCDTTTGITGQDEDMADVLRMVLKMGLRLIVIGTAVGLLASIGLARLAASQLWGISPHDPIALGGVVAVVALAGFAACYFPARRATRVDPLIALRYE